MASREEIRFRREKIVEICNVDKVPTTDFKEIKKKLLEKWNIEVSELTIRRDIDALREQGKIEKKQGKDEKKSQDKKKIKKLHDKGIPVVKYMEERLNLPRNTIYDYIQELTEEGEITEELTEIRARRLKKVKFLYYKKQKTIPEIAKELDMEGYEDVIEDDIQIMENRKNSHLKRQETIKKSEEYKALQKRRNEEEKLYFEEGVSIEKLAEMYHLSETTISTDITITREKRKKEGKSIFTPQEEKEIEIEQKVKKLYNMGLEESYIAEKLEIDIHKVMAIIINLRRRKEIVKNLNEIKQEIEQKIKHLYFEQEETIEEIIKDFDMQGYEEIIQGYIKRIILKEAETIKSDNNYIDYCKTKLRQGEKLKEEELEKLKEAAKRTGRYECAFLYLKACSKQGKIKESIVFSGKQKNREDFTEKQRERMKQIEEICKQIDIAITTLRKEKGGEEAIKKATELSGLSEDEVKRFHVKLFHKKQKNENRKNSVEEMEIKQPEENDDGDEPDIA